MAALTSRNRTLGSWLRTRFTAFVPSVRAMSITFDQYNESLNRAPGPVDFDEAKQIIKAYIDGQKDKYESEQEPFAISIFHFSRDNNNFIEIAIDTKEKYRLLLECRYRKKLWKFSWLSMYRKDYHIPTIQDLNNLVAEFYQMEIEQYRQYFEELPFKESAPLMLGVGAGR